MRINIPLRNPRTGETRSIKLGFSWTLFLFSGFMGLPLFIRRLHPLAALFLVVWLVGVLAPRLVRSEAESSLMFAAFVMIEIGLSIWIGIKGNEMTAKHWLEAG